MNRTRRAFTLVEMTVAVVVLLAVIIATSKIFSTASKVTSMGEATADVLQQAGVIEEQLRRDIERISQDGYMAIQCVAVRNDVRRVINNLVSAGSGDNAPLLDPTLPPNAVLRADSVTFFVAGQETSMRWSGPNDATDYGGNQQSRVWRVFYGHGVQLPGLANDPSGAGTAARPIILGVDPVPPVGQSQQIVPWTWWNPTPTLRQVKWRWGGLTQATAGMPRVSPNQPGAREWVLCRKAVLLADDLGSQLYYPDFGTPSATLGPTATPSLFGDLSYTAPAGADSNWMYREMRARGYTPYSTNLIPSPMLQSGWVDVATSGPEMLRRVIAPSLTLNNPVEFGSGANAYAVYSIVPPWAAQNGAGGVLNLPPIGWPVGGMAEPWPTTGAVTSPSIAGGTGNVSNFTSQRDRIVRGTFGPMHRNDLLTSAGYATVGLLGWPRAEKEVPNLDRRSEILVTPVLSTNCSSFQVDWTWERGTGEQTDAVGYLLDAYPHLGNAANQRVLMRGYEPDAGTWDSDAGAFRRVPRPHPWFGFPDNGHGTGTGAVIPLKWQQMGVALAQSLWAMPDQGVGGMPAGWSSNAFMRGVAQWIEGIDNDPTVPAISAPFGVNVPVRVYHAIFGFNQGEAYTVTPDGLRVLRDDFTPFPSKLRITLTLHDPRLTLDRGREFQFVIDVPRRKK